MYKVHVDWRTLNFFLVSVVFTFFTYCNRITYKVIIPASEVRKDIQKKFPESSTYAGILEITLSNPSLLLGKNKDKLTISLDAAISELLTKDILSTGRIVFSSGLQFDDSTAEFLYHQVTIDTVDLDMKQLNKQIQAGVKDVISSIIRKNLENAPFYRMKTKGIKTTIAKLFIRKVRIEKDAIVVTLGI